MAAKKTVKTEETEIKEEAKEKAVNKTDKVKIKIARTPGQKVQEDVVIAVNGQRYQIQRGVEVEVPVAVAKALDLWRYHQDEAERIEYELMN